MEGQLKKSCIAISLFWVFIFICSCAHEAPKSELQKGYFIKKSDLDTILGDKIINVAAGKFRKNNFESLLKIKKDQLQTESALYDIEQLDEYHFVLRPKKNYAEARNFNLLIKTNDSFITDYLAFNDFSIVDIRPDSTDWVLLLTDFNQGNQYWTSEYQIKIVKLDSNFKKRWDLTKKGNKPLSAQDLIINSNHYLFYVEVMLGCHMCFVSVELALTKDGQFLYAKSIGKENVDISDSQLDTVLQKVFNGK